MNMNQRQIIIYLLLKIIKDINSEEPIIKFIVNPNDYIYQQFTVLLDNLKNKKIMERKKKNQETIE